MTSLARLLESALSRPETSEWLDPEDRGVLETDGDALSPHALVLLGRLVRTGALAPAERTALDAWLTEPARRDPERWKAVGQEVKADLARIDDALARGDGAALALRDDVESVLVLLGRALLAQGDDSLVPVERELLAAVTPADEAATAEVFDVPKAPPPGAWLRSAARLDETSWWLDAVNVLLLRERVGAVVLPVSEAARTVPPVRVSRLARERFGSASAEVTAQEDELGSRRLVLVARLFDGQVEVLATGLGDDEDDAPGLCIRNSDGTDRGLESVTGRGVAASRSVSGFWVPLAGVSESGVLVVRFRGPDGVLEERLSLELSG